MLALIWLLGVTSARADGAPTPTEVGARPARRAPDLSLFVRRAPGASSPWLTPPAVPERGRRGAPVCAGDVCQPRVAIPGIEPGFRGSRTDAVLAMLAGSPFNPVSKAARTLSNVRIDYSPATSSSGERGWGRVVLSLRWRIDASGAPAR